MSETSTGQELPCRPRCRCHYRSNGRRGRVSAGRCSVNRMPIVAAVLVGPGLLRTARRGRSGAPGSLIARIVHRLAAVVHGLATSIHRVLAAKIRRLSTTGIPIAILTPATAASMLIPMVSVVATAIPVVRPTACLGFSTAHGKAEHSGCVERRLRFIDLTPF